MTRLGLGWPLWLPTSNTPCQQIRYVNKYVSVLQTTSYNFPSTKTTGKICEAQGLFEKTQSSILPTLKW